MGGAAVTEPASHRGGSRWSLRQLGAFWPALAVIAMLLLAWDQAVAWSARPDTVALVPGPLDVANALAELAEEGVLLNYIVASLFRVTWGFLLAAAVGVPVGLMLGWFRPAFLAFNPVIQIFRPISPIAWIPLVILWFGLSMVAPIFLIFLASVFPIIVSSAAAVRNIQPNYVRAARNFGLKRWQLFRRVVVPATLPQVFTGLRIALGIAWLVIVAAEMIVGNPRVGGLGYLIMDARNAGNRYDRVVAGMVLIGVIGLILDWLMRRFENLDEIRWGHAA